MPPETKRHSVILPSWCLAIQWVVAALFYLPTICSFRMEAPTAKHIVPSSLFRSNAPLHRLYYQNEGGRQYPSSHPNNQPSPNNDNNNDNKKKKQNQISVPVIGPFFGQQRMLLPGETMRIPTTPILSQSIAECLVRQSTMATPWVAILEEQGTVTTSMGRYATLAAVTGIGETTTNQHRHSPPGIHTDDARHFLERLRASPDVSIELMGIGRAIITGFHYEMRSDIENYDDDYDDIAYGEAESDDEECDLDDERHECDLGARKHQILCGKLKILADESASRFRNSSPVHALSNMASMANSIHFLHQTRQQLVQKLRALQARMDELENLHDHDGLGLLFRDNRVKTDQFTVLQTTPYRLGQSNNFGLGSTATSMASIPALTTRTMDAIKPYYSPKKWSSEDFYYEMLSFTAVMTLRECITPLDVARAVTCSNTSDRLRLVHTWMHQHVLELYQMENHFTMRLQHEDGSL